MLYLTIIQATEGNCWIIDDMSQSKNQQIWETLSTQSGIQSLTLHLRSDGILHKIPNIAIQHLPNIKFFEVRQSINTMLFFNTFDNLRYFINCYLTAYLWVNFDFEFRSSMAQSRQFFPSTLPTPHHLRP